MERVPQTTLVPHIDDESHAAKDNACGNVRYKSHEDQRQAEVQRLTEVQRREENQVHTPVGITTYFRGRDSSGKKKSRRRRVIPKAHMTKGGNHKEEFTDLARGRRHLRSSRIEVRAKQNEQIMESHGKRSRAPWDRYDTNANRRAKQAVFKT